MIVEKIMKPYEYKNTLKYLRKVTGEETVRIGFDLTDFAIELLIESIRNENPQIKNEELWQEIKRIIWKVRKQAQEIYSKNLSKY